MTSPKVIIRKDKPVAALRVTVVYLVSLKRPYPVFVSVFPIPIRSDGMCFKVVVTSIGHKLTRYTGYFSTEKGAETWGISTAKNHFHQLNELFEF